MALQEVWPTLETVAMPAPSVDTADDAKARLWAARCAYQLMEQGLCLFVRNAAEASSSGVSCRLCGENVRYWATWDVVGQEESVTGYEPGGVTSDVWLVSSCSLFVLLGLHAGAFAWVRTQDVCFTVGTADPAALDSINDEDDYELRLPMKNRTSSLLLDV